MVAGSFPALTHGSSPLARGLPCIASAPVGRSRIIPARAGFTGLCTSAFAPKQDHPRSRGVYSFSRRRATDTGGSSPLARGLRADARDPRDAAGIIPARAGFTGLSAEIGAGDCGSSPLARGLPNAAGTTGGRRRIIPARAGFTRLGTSISRPSQDHPRSRGVYESKGGKRAMAKGSSPLARGLRPCALNARPLVRIIPARAGFTDINRLTKSTKDGSSPLARGLLLAGRPSYYE